MKNFLLTLSLLMRPNINKDHIERLSYEALIYDKAPRGIKNSYNSSLLVRSEHQNGEFVFGSANLLDINGQKAIITAYHVVEDGQKIYVMEKNQNVVEVELAFYDKIRDIAILKPKSNLIITSSIKLKIDDDGLIGKEVYHCGHPSVIKFNLSRGLITSYSSEFLIIDSFSLPGSSGSLVFNEDGEAIGIVIAVAMSFSGPQPQPVDNVVLVSRLKKNDAKIFFQSILSHG